MKFNTYKLILISVLSLFMATYAQAEGELKKHSGAYFDVDYPQEFAAHEINPSEAYFTSPDGEVEFFVYSPLWSGKPETYLEIKQDENLVVRSSQKVIKDGVYQDHIQIEWATIAANDGSYTRAFMHRRACHSDGFVDCLSHVFGIQYADKQAYEQYRDAYILFKKSLKQYAD